MLGAVGTPDVPPGVIERGLLLTLRFELDLYVNLRPFVSGPNRFNDGVDMLVVRENTEGTYAGEGGFLRKGTPHEVATQGSVNTRMGAERAVRYAFDLAQARERKHVTLVHKTNVLTFAGDLWQRTFDAVAAEYPDVGTAYHHVDAACIYFVQDPGSLRRDRHRQPLRRHPHRSRRRGVGRHRPGGVGQPQPGPHRAVPVRAGARLGARHRRHREGGSARRDHLGRDDVGVPRARPTPRPEYTPRSTSPTTSTRDRTAEIGDAIAGTAREDLTMPIEKTEKIWMDGELVAVGRGARPRADPQPALRLGRVRGDPHLRGRRRPGGVPPHRPHPAPVRLRQAHHDGDPVHARRARRARASSPCARAGSTPATCGRSRSSATARSGSTRCRAR